MPRIYTVIHSICLFVLICGTVVLVGCSRPTGSISGKVTYKGELLKVGNISFVSTEGQQTASTMINEDGTYTIQNITAGSCKVCVETSSYNPANMSGDKFAQAKYNMPGGQKQKEAAAAKPLDSSIKVPEGYHPSDPADAQSKRNKARFTSISEKYAKSDTTDLSYTVVAGAQTFDIDLQ